MPLEVLDGVNSKTSFCAVHQFEKFLSVRLHKSRIDPYHTSVEANPIGLGSVWHLLELPAQAESQLTNSMSQVYNLVARPEGRADLVFRNALDWLRGQKQQEFPGFGIASSTWPYQLTGTQHPRAAETLDLDWDVADARTWQGLD